MNTRLCFRALMLGPLLLLLNAPLASASLIVELDHVTPFGPFTPYSATYDYVYKITIPDGDILAGGSYFTIYDIPGVATVEQPAGWSIAAPLLGATPTGLTPTDSAAARNVTFSFDPCSTFSNTCIIGTGQTISGFLIRSIYDLPMIAGEFSWKDYGSLNDFDQVNFNDVQNGLGTVLIPYAGNAIPQLLPIEGIPTSFDDTTVPEPASILLLSAGLIALAGANKKKGRR